MCVNVVGKLSDYSLNVVGKLSDDSLNVVDRLSDYSFCFLAMAGMNGKGDIHVKKFSSDGKSVSAIQCSSQWRLWEQALLPAFEKAVSQHINLIQ